MARGPHSKLVSTNPYLGTVRNHVEVVESGIDRNNPSEESKAALESIHGITGEIVGTEKTQTLTNKTYLGNGAGITDLDGDAVTTGTVVAGRLPALNAITAPAADVAMNSKKITGLAAPTEDDDAATMEYVDDKYSRTAYSHSFSNASSVPITHSLGYYPDVTILKEISSGVYDEVEAQVAHASTLALTVTLSGATEGLVLMR